MLVSFQWLRQKTCSVSPMKSGARLSAISADSSLVREHRGLRAGIRVSHANAVKVHRRRVHADEHASLERWTGGRCFASTLLWPHQAAHSEEACEGERVEAAQLERDAVGQRERLADADRAEEQSAQAHGGGGCVAVPQAARQETRQRDAEAKAAVDEREEDARRRG